MKLLIAPLMLLVVLAAPKIWSAEPMATTKKAEAAPTQAELEKQFQERLSGATLSGYFTEGDSAKTTDGLKKDRYKISKLTKLAGEYWMFQCRIQYGGKDVEVPLPLRVVWADQTPVITLDKVPVPGMGTFSSRVVIDGNQYAGTWSGGDHGGHLFGTIEKEGSPAR